MRYLKPYNETKTFTPLVDKFIEKILGYKSEFIDNFILKNDQWEIRSGYAPRKTIAFENKITDKWENLSIEDHSGFRNSIRIFYNDRYQNDVSINDISGYDKGTDRSEMVLIHIFDGIIRSSNGAVDYFRQMEIVRNAIPKITEAEIKENFADIIDLSTSHMVHRMERGGYQTSWKLNIYYSKRVFNLKSPGLEIIMDDDVQTIMSEIMSATNRIKNEYGLLTTVNFSEREIIIELNAIDPLTGKKIG